MKGRLVTEEELDWLIDALEPTLIDSYEGLKQSDTSCTN